MSFKLMAMSGDIVLTKMRFLVGEKLDRSENEFETKQWDQTRFEKPSVIFNIIKKFKNIPLLIYVS